MDYVEVGPPYYYCVAANCDACQLWISQAGNFIIHGSGVVLAANKVIFNGTLYQ